MSVSSQRIVGAVKDYSKGPPGVPGALGTENRARDVLTGLFFPRRPPCPRGRGRRALRTWSASVPTTRSNAISVRTRSHRLIFGHKGRILKSFAMPAWKRLCRISGPVGVLAANGRRYENQNCFGVAARRWADIHQARAVPRADNAPLQCVQPNFVFGLFRTSWTSLSCSMIQLTDAVALETTH